MDPTTIGFLGIGALLVLLLLRVPIGVAMIATSIVGIWAVAGQRALWGVTGVIPYTFASTWTLSSIPMFLMMGYVCYHAGLTKGLFECARLWLSRLPGGLAIASLMGAAGFAAVTGSSVACAAAMGRIAVPEMLRHRYDAALASGTLAAAGTLGALIPPSILLILYAIIAQQPVTPLFLGGAAAGLLTLASYIAVIVIRVKLNPSLAPGVDVAPSFRERFQALFEMWPLIALIVFVFGGMFSGIFTATEAGAVGATMSCVIALLKGALTWEAFKNSLVETLVVTASLFIIGCGAALLTAFLAYSGSGPVITDAILALGASPLAIIISVTIVYFVLGMFIEPIGVMLLTMPVLLPLVEGSGISMIWFGVYIVKQLEIGMIAPPVGMNVFVIKGVVGNLIPLATIYRGIMWFLVADFAVSAIMIAFPQTVMFLPELLK